MKTGERTITDAGPTRLIDDFHRSAIPAVNSHNLDFADHTHIFSPTYSEIADGVLGDVAGARDFWLNVAELVRATDATLGPCPFEMKYSRFRLLSDNVALASATVAVGLGYSDGSSKVINVVLTMVWTKSGDRWYIEHMHREILPDVESS